MNEPRTRRILHYRLSEELGRDRVGAVFRGVDEQLDRPVVVKAVRASDLAAPEAVDTLRDAFRRGAQATARVGHPNFVTIYAFERVGAVDLIVMEDVSGETLLERVLAGARWRATDAAKLVARIAETVAAAHARGIAHGHLSLANVKLLPRGNLKVLDLGVPKASAHPGIAVPVLPVGNAESFRADVRALARMTCELIAGTVPVDTDVAGVPLGDTGLALVDASRVWENYGVLAPVLGRALGPEADAFPDAAAFRDALLEPMHGRRWAAPEPMDEPDDELGPLHAPGTGRRPPLVLPADLARRAGVATETGMPVLSHRGPLDRFRDVADDAFDRATTSRRPVIVAATLGLLLLAGALAVARLFLSSGGATAADLSVPSIPPAAPAFLPPIAAADSGVTEADSATRFEDPPASPVVTPPPSPPVTRTVTPAVRSARVTARPAGTSIRVASQPDAAWSDAAELSVSGRDSLLVTFSRPGHVTEQRVFRGSPLNVALRPDSVTVVFAANVPTQVLFQDGGDWRSLGVTDLTPLTTRLPTGRHRIEFRAPDQEPWSASHDLLVPGRSYRVQKLDFPTRGGLIVTIEPDWAYVSLNGGQDREAPVRYDDLPMGSHLVRISRPGFRTIIDTVLVRPGRVTSQSYTLNPGS